ncbi:MAG: histidine kinase [Acidobacteriota bacterium]
MDEPGDTSRAYIVWSRWIGLAVVAWLAIGTLNWLGRSSYTSQAVIATTGALIALGFSVWRFSALCPWPAGPRLTFFVIHAGLGLAFVMLLMAIAYQTQAMTTGQSFLDVVRQSQLLRWEFLLGLWLYGLLAGAAYTHRLRQSLQRQRRAAEQAEALATQAQLAALRTQLHPHFLFNALHSIAALVPEGGPAGQAIERLGDLLRYALDQTGEADVTLADELAFTENYLELEKLGMGESLQIRRGIESPTMHCWLPSFTLQTLVENAVRHGLSARRGGGELVIRARQTPEALELQVENDLAQPAIIPERKNGHGLATLERRLEVRYAGQARLRTEVRDDRFVASVSVPWSSTSTGEISGP